MAFPIDVSRYRYYLRMAANDGIVVAGVFRSTKKRVHFRVLHSDAPQVATPIVKSLAKRKLVKMVLEKWDGNVGVDLALSAHHAFEGVPHSEIGGEAKYLPSSGGFGEVPADQDL